MIVAVIKKTTSPSSDVKFFEVCVAAFGEKTGDTPQEMSPAAEGGGGGGCT